MKLILLPVDLFGIGAFSGDAVCRRPTGTGDLYKIATPAVGRGMSREGGLPTGRISALARYNWHIILQSRKATLSQTALRGRVEWVRYSASTVLTQGISCRSPPAPPSDARQLEYWEFDG